MTRPEVCAETARIAELYGNPKCKISESWLWRIETNQGTASGVKLLTLTYIYRLDTQELLGTDDTATAMVFSQWRHPLSPENHILIDPGPLDDLVAQLLPGEYVEPPETTAILPNDPQFSSDRYVRAIIGTRDNRAYPMLRPGAVVLIDRQRRDINKRVKIRHEFDTPIFFFETHGTPICGWAHRNKNGTVDIWAHPAAQMAPVNLFYEQEAQLVGQVVAVQMWLTTESGDL
jgi:hypothetical protein